MYLNGGRANEFVSQKMPFTIALLLAKDEDMQARHHKRKIHVVDFVISIWSQ